MLSKLTVSLCLLGGEQNIFAQQGFLKAPTFIKRHVPNVPFQGVPLNVPESSLSGLGFQNESVFFFFPLSVRVVSCLLCHNEYEK